MTKELNVFTESRYSSWLKMFEVPATSTIPLKVSDVLYRDVYNVVQSGLFDSNMSARAKQYERVNLVSQ